MKVLASADTYTKCFDQLFNGMYNAHVLAPVAQWIEHRSSEPGVVGSNPPRRATCYVSLS